MKPTISAEIFEDTSSAQIAIFDGEAAVSRLSLDADSLLALIQQLGDVHKLLTANKPIPAIEGQTIQAVFNTRWYIHTEMVGEAAALSFYHPAYGQSVSLFRSIR